MTVIIAMMNRASAAQIGAEPTETHRFSHVNEQSTQNPAQRQRRSPAAQGSALEDPHEGSLMIAPKELKDREPPDKNTAFLIIWKITAKLWRKVQGWANRSGSKAEPATMEMSAIAVGELQRNKKENKKSKKNKKTRNNCTRVPTRVGPAQGRRSS